ncbi:MAG: hypothetical protein A2Y12_02430 [Planctomycetes bacterium GWF2_42_9]|nr:MAG: hypothetical protein A2Y12_02430 [Planctomycetes bacterium GWF2_42_9]
MDMRCRSAEFRFDCYHNLILFGYNHLIYGDENVRFSPNFEIGENGVLLAWKYPRKHKSCYGKRPLRLAASMF